MKILSKAKMSFKMLKLVAKHNLTRQEPVFKGILDVLQGLFSIIAFKRQSRNVFITCAICGSSAYCVFWKLVVGSKIKADPWLAN